MNTGRDISLLHRRLAQAGANDGDLFFHRGKKPTADQIGWISPMEVDGRTLVDARLYSLCSVPQNSFDSQPASLSGV